jgi:hypothetical protein
MRAVDIGLLAVVCLGTILCDPLGRVLRIELISWSLRRQGVTRAKIRDLAVEEAKRERRNLAVQVLTLLIKLFKK